jgi:imidazole glycerol-phosphate synthase subunit HisF
MLRTRVIPCLLMRDGGLVKTVRFHDPRYVGDPINAVKIFNGKEVDELIILDISATTENRRPPMGLIADIASECFMPVCYGGGVRSLDDIAEILRLGIEKVAINSAAIESPDLVRTAAARFGGQSIVASIDVRKNFWGRYRVWSHGGTWNAGLDPVEHARRMADAGSGEILLTSIDRDGTMKGYDLELIRRVTAAVDVPVIACGGAGSLEDLATAVHDGAAAAVAIGSMAVYQWSTLSVLINFPTPSELERALNRNNPE